jgi:hypothetical protein
MTKNPRYASIGFTLVHRSLCSGVKRCSALISASLAVIWLGVLVTSCGIYIGSGPPSASSPPPAPQATTQPPTPTSGGASCHGYDLTHENSTKTFTGIVVPNGCVMVVQAWSAEGVGSYSWPDSVGVAAVGPGTYTFTLTSGSYQITTVDQGQAQYCKDIRSLQQQNLPDTHNYPMSGWSSC